MQLVVHPQQTNSCMAFAHLGVRANIHLGGGVKPSFARIMPEWRTQIVFTWPRTNNELLQCLFFDGRRIVSDERLPEHYPTRNVSQVDGYLFRSMTQLLSQTDVLSFARINVVSARILGGQLPLLTPIPYAYAFTARGKAVQNGTQPVSDLTHPGRLGNTCLAMMD